MKICSVGAELFLADEREDMTKLTGAFRGFSNASIKGASAREHASSYKTRL
jgi:hypothetical protein